MGHHGLWRILREEIGVDLAGGYGRQWWEGGVVMVGGEYHFV